MRFVVAVQTSSKDTVADTACVASSDVIDLTAHSTESGYVGETIETSEDIDEDFSDEVLQHY